MQLRELAIRHGVHVVLVDEYKTSRLCSACFGELEGFPQGKRAARTDADVPSRSKKRGKRGGGKLRYFLPDLPFEIAFFSGFLPSTLTLTAVHPAPTLTLPSCKLAFPIVIGDAHTAKLVGAALERPTTGYGAAILAAQG